MEKYAQPYRLQVATGGVQLTGGRFARAFENNIEFLKHFNLDRLLYWYRVKAGRPAPNAPYAAGVGTFENGLKGQTVGEFLMGAGTTLLWREDAQLRTMVQAILEELEACQEEDGFLLPITRREFGTREYANYVRAWVTFGLLDSGYAGETAGFRLARAMTDYFNRSWVLPFAKYMNLGFQGILPSTRIYDSPVGKWEDIETAKNHYQEIWWLEQLIEKDHLAIYDHPGDHPHSTLLTSLEAYLDLYRVTGEPIYLNAVKSALEMYEDQWQHVGGGIVMCEGPRGDYYPGCNWLSREHLYNELCSTNFWILLNQRMHRLFPEDAHYADEMETSIYNVLFAAQVGSQGFHYLNYLERTKDWRYLDPATCCAGLGSRLCGLLPQFLYTYTDDTVYVDLYASSQAVFPNGVELECETDIPDGGHIRLKIKKTNRPITLKLRIPRWAAKNGKSYYETYENVKDGTVIEKDFPIRLRVTRYTGGEQIIGKERYALEYGPLLYAAMGAPSPVEVTWDPDHPEQWFTPAATGQLDLREDNRHTYRAYCDIHDEPFSVYPIVTLPSINREEFPK